MAADGSIVIDTRIDTSGFKDGSVNLQNQFSKLASGARKLGVAIGAAFSVRAIAQFAKECLDLGSDLQEVQNVVDVTFATMNDQVDAFAQNAVNTAGLSETMAKRYAGTFGAMSKAFGFAESEAFAMSTALTQLAGDVASFYNITQDEAYTKLKSVFTGETESLKDLGVVMTQAALDSYALANGYGRTTSAMSEQEKVALRYAFVMDQLSAASGDFIRTSDGWANQTRVLALQFEQLKATIGQGLINVLTPVIKVINTILAGLQAVAKAFAQFTALLFGNAGGGTQGEIAGVAEGYQSAAGGAEDLAKGTEKAGKAAKKYLAGFDEIQKIGEESSGGSGGGAGGVGGAGGFDLGTTFGSAAPIEDNISPQMETLASKAREVLDLLKPLATWTIEEGGPAAVELLASAFRLLGSVLSPVFNGLKELLKWLEPVFEFVGDTAVEILGWFSDAFDDLAELFKKKGPQIEDIFSNIGEALAAVWDVIEPLLSDMVDVFGEAFDWIMEIVEDAIEAVIDILHGLTDFITGVFTDDWDQAWSGIEEIFEATGEFLEDVAESILSALGLSFEDLETIIKDAVNGIIGSINGMISGIVSGINSVIRALNKLSFDIPDWVPEFGGKKFGFDIDTIVAPQIPYLAKGAVIPPNAPFLAMLGDQKNGNNIEAPEDLIRKIVREETGTREQININFTGDLAGLARVMKPAIDRENRRVGDNLVTEVM